MINYLSYGLLSRARCLKATWFSFACIY